jgi:hypothetical protein
LHTVLPAPVQHLLLHTALTPSVQDLLLHTAFTAPVQHRLLHMAFTAPVQQLLSHTAFTAPVQRVLLHTVLAPAALAHGLNPPLRTCCAGGARALFRPASRPSRPLLSRPSQRPP